MSYNLYTWQVPPFIQGVPSPQTGSTGGQAGGNGVQPVVWVQSAPQDPGVHISRYCKLSTKLARIAAPIV